MKTFRFRIKFYTHFAGMIRCEEQKINSNIHENVSLSLSSYDEKTITEGTVFVLSCGGFFSEKEAFDQGVKFKKALLISGPVLKIGIDAGRDRSGSSMSTGLKESMFRKSLVIFI